MKYYKYYKDADAEHKEITKEEAYRTLQGYWKEEKLKEIIDKEYGFRLYTPVAVVYTKDNEGRIPQAGFYGHIEEDYYE